MPIGPAIAIEEQDVRIEHSKQGDQVWFYSTIVGVPALVLLWWLRASVRALDHNPSTVSAEES